MKRRCKWWRLSFSAAEKQIINHADGTYKKMKSTGRPSTCRKDVLRLLKDDLSKFYDNNDFPEKNICSYFLKTIVLRLYEEERSWDAKHLLQRYVEALKKTVFSLEARFIEHYFIKHENLLAEKDIPGRELDMIKKHFTSILVHYAGADPGRLPQSSGRRSEMRRNNIRPVYFPLYFFHLTSAFCERYISLCYILCITICILVGLVLIRLH